MVAAMNSDPHASRRTLRLGAGAIGVAIAPDVLPDGSWETAPTPYEADAFLVWIWAEAGSPTPGVPALADLNI
jgi:hypothetical protein